MVSSDSAARITAEVLRRLAATPDARLREIMTALVTHAHGFTRETGLTEEEWSRAVQFLTRAGQISTGGRQEFVLLSDTLGLSMLVDAINHHVAPAGSRAVNHGSAATPDIGGQLPVTESTVLGPFYVPGSPRRDFGASTALRPAGDPAWFTGRVTDPAGRPIAGAEIDVWQNGDNMLYDVQDPIAPPGHLRGLFHSRDDGGYALLGVRPVDYPIPHDGPAGELLTATGRHPWRPAHLHMSVRAPGFRPVTTHVFDDASRYLDSDAVFGVKRSLVRHFDRHEPGSPGRPAGVADDQAWYSVTFDVVLAPSGTPAP
ncbi:hypothetical protein BL253_28185 [Pseudofrankia asymbiotica]|uniref:Hydroxyquinol 1,2-dioxygenase n=2 Tax=Pseudofrankia asymbiotica TaxID=1834516 RepID=A0A1V2I3W4_9ACTN|nr:dioxygenase [Pseudofrankia asymbiotica]ONH25254.1 hypothetical protein BL253_28185 [Pseudofrankia asymbiotica]